MARIQLRTIHSLHSFITRFALTVPLALATGCLLSTSPDPASNAGLEPKKEDERIIWLDAEVFDTDAPVGQFGLEMGAFEKRYLDERAGLGELGLYLFDDMGICGHGSQLRTRPPVAQQHEQILHANVAVKVEVS